MTLGAFDESDARRIARAVRRVEAMPGSSSYGDRPEPGQPPPNYFRPFELAEVLLFGDTAEAKLLVWDPANGTYSADDEQTFDVEDLAGNCWGVTGDRGWARAVWKESGICWEVFVNPGQAAYLGKLDSGISPGASETVSIWDKDGDTGDNLVAYDWLLKVGSSIASGAKVVIAAFPNDQRFYITHAQCE